MTEPTPRPDNDANKGATETDARDKRIPANPARPDIHGNMSDQLPHRHSEDLAGSDSDFPEPGSNPEHTGQKSH